MKFKKAYVLKLMTAIMLVLFSTISYGQPSQSGGNGSASATWVILISIITLLLLVILLLGNMLVKLVKLVVEKQKKASVTVVLLLLALSSVYANDAAPAAAAGNTLTASWNLIIASAVLAVELVVILVFLLQIRSLLNILAGKKREKRAPIVIHLPRLLDMFNASVAVEKEADVMTSHEYDGIRELDNNLPPWWKYGFYVTIVWSFAYLFYYHVYGAPNSIEIYHTEMEDADVARKEYLAKNALNVDEGNVQMADAAGIAEGALVFAENCKACHGGAGEGGVGPNLTDDYWLHGGHLNDIFKTIKYGWAAKGMKAWQTDLSPIQIKNVASFIKTLHGTNPPMAKAPQGELLMDSVAAGSQGAAGAVNDSVSIKSKQQK